MSEEAELKVYPVTIKLPGGIWHPASQDLRDNIADWLEQHQVDEEDFDSFYMKDPEDAANGDFYHRSVSSLTYICYSFRDSKLATMFKLTFG